MKDFPNLAKQETENKWHSETLRMKRLDLAFRNITLATRMRGWSREGSIIYSRQQQNLHKVMGYIIFSFSSIFLKELSLGQKRGCIVSWPLTEPLMWFPAPPSPQRAYSREQKCTLKDPLPVTKKKIIWLIHSQQGTSSCKLFMFCKGNHGRRRQAHKDLQGQTRGPQFYNNVSCGFRMLFKAQEWDSTSGQHLLYQWTPSRPIHFLA